MLEVERNTMNGVNCVFSYESTPNERSELVCLVNYQNEGKMDNIYDFLEELRLHKHKLTGQLKIDIANTHSDMEWINATSIFLKGLEPRHTVPGNIIYSMSDICHQYKYLKVKSPLTKKQRLFISSNLIDYWDQMTLEMKIKLYPF